MFALAKLANTVDRVKPEALWQRETKSADSKGKRLQASRRDSFLRFDLNCSNRPVRTRMPGGVGGDRSVTLAAPIPIPGSRCGYAAG